jgi:nickel/cobalt transporter (NicO) family protein
LGNMKTSSLIAAVTLCLLLAQPAFSHPHAWITFRTSLILDDNGKVTGIGQEWIFDDGYAATALDGLDTDNNGAYSKEELAPLTKENIASLQEFEYFIAARVAGAKLPFGTVTFFDQVYEAGKLKLTFDVPLAQPFDPKSGELVVKVYDQDFFIAFDYAASDPVNSRGQLVNGCTQELRPIPTDAELDQTREFLSTKGPDWKPETQEDFGAMFAQALVVSCGGNAVAASVEKPEKPAQVVENSSKIDPSKLIVQPRDGSNAASFLESPVAWLQQQQRAFSGAMQGSLRQLQAGSLSAIWSLLGLSFAYGVFHAAGPGHGKAVVTSWLLATESDLKRGALVAFLSALFQALTAIVLVSALFLIVASAGAVARDVSGWLESASYAMIAAVGIYLIWSTFFGHGHSHDSHTHDQRHHGHEHHHHHDHGHAHAAEPAQLRGDDWSLKKAVAMSFAIGIRPCAGAILALVGANALGIYWAGIAATLVMGFGVFLTVALIAALTVYAKSFAIGLAKRDGRLLGWIISGLRLGGGAVITLIGVMMFVASLRSGVAAI